MLPRRSVASTRAPRRELYSAVDAAVVAFNNLALQPVRNVPAVHGIMPCRCRCPRRLTMFAPIRTRVDLPTSVRIRHRRIFRAYRHCHCFFNEIRLSNHLPRVLMWIGITQFLEWVLSFSGMETERSSTARVERAHSDRARSASKKGTWLLPTLSSLACSLST